MDRTPRVVGIDVSKQALDVHLRPGPIRARVTTTAAGWQDLIRQVAAPGPVCIVFEATGRYHRGVTTALAAAGRPPAVVTPAWTHAFAKREGRRAKTDRGDAGLLARYAQQKQPDPTPVPTATTTNLTDLASYREDLVALRTMEKNRAPAMDPLVRTMIAAHITALDARLAAVEAASAARIATDPFWSERVATRKAVPGLRDVLAPQLAVGLIERGPGDEGA